MLCRARQAWQFIKRLHTIPATRWLYWSPTAVFLSQYCYVPLQITGRSMQPILNPDTSSWKDIGIFDRFSILTLCGFQRDDIVALRSPENPHRILVKRIIGLEGDLVTTLPPCPDPMVRVPQGHAWIEGDEPLHSDDSNRFGPVPLALIHSKLVFITWPPSRFGFVAVPTAPLVRNGPAYRHAMALFERDRSRKSRVQRNPASK